MMRAFLKLTWLELKIFAREPLGLIGALIVPAIIVLGLGRSLGSVANRSADVSNFIKVDLPVLAAMTAAVNAVLSLVTIVAIYREGGILKRLRATPLRPAVILSAHVAVKVIQTTATLIVMMIAGRRMLSMHLDMRTLSFAAAAVVSMISIISIGFLLASVVPTARFAQPIGALVLYPMLAISGLFMPLALYPPWLSALAHALPMTYAVSLLKGIWVGHAWTAHVTDIGALVVLGGLFTGLSSRFFRWE